MQPLGIDGAWLTHTRPYHDERGSFREWFTAAEFTGALGYGLPLAQANFSVSVAGAVRGIHFTAVPPGQAKYVACVSGQIFDVIVDVREGSPTFGTWEAVRLSALNAAVFLSEGLGHAWMALSEEAVMIYLCSHAYEPAAEFAITPLDPQIAIEWPVRDLVMSGRDRAAPTLAQMQAAKLLPSYSSC